MSTAATNKSAPKIIIVTGYSGAGKSSVLRALEDIGFYCVDNLPVQLMPSFFQVMQGLSKQSIALCIDIRNGDGLIKLMHELQEKHAKNDAKISLVFVMASTDVLIKRYQETRRRHPLGNNELLSDAIKQERKLLEPMRVSADITLQTDRLTIHELRNQVHGIFSNDICRPLVVNVISFGFKYGIPHESNFIFDVRSLPNPYFVKDLRSLDGTNSAIREYLFSKELVKEYWQRLLDFMIYSIGVSTKDGRSFLNIAIGCTGGRHRSVAFAHELSKNELENVAIIVKHRDKHIETYQSHP